MYRNSMYQQDDLDTLLDLVQHNPLGVLVSVTGDNAEATHLPCLVARTQDQLYLVTHLAKTTFARLQLGPDKPVMLIFRGADSYISPRWYKDQEFDVPTWDYSAAHFWGICHPMSSDAELRSLLHETVDEFESDSANPFSLNGVNTDFMDEIQQGILGIRVEVKKAQGVFKLSQEKQRDDLQTILRGLDETKGQGGGCPVAHDIARANKEKKL